MLVAAKNIEVVIAEMRADVLVGLHVSCPLVLLNFNEKEWNVSKF
jgi:hypothetical protein